MRRCTLILPDAGPINSLWVADRLDLFLKLDMRIIIVDAVYDELTSDMTYLKDREVKSFIDTHNPPFMIEPTDMVVSNERSGEEGKSLRKCWRARHDRLHLVR